MWKSVAQEALSTEAIIALLQEAGAVEASWLAEQPAQWALPVEELGTVAVVAARRGGVVQARVSRVAEGDSFVSRPPPDPNAVAAPPTPRPTREQIAVGNLGSFEELVAAARKLSASDLHIIALRPSMFRIAGEMVPKGETFSAEQVEQLVMPLVPQRLHPVLERDGSCDFALQHPTAGRFRVNVSRQRTGLKACLRVIPPEVPTLASLGLPESLAQAIHHHQGLIVVTGPYGARQDHHAGGAGRPHQLARPPTT